MKLKQLIAAVVWTATLAVPATSFAQHHDLTHDQAAEEDALVGFGVAPTVVGGVIQPLGPAPCAQAPASVGGPTDLCAYQLHHLTPEEVTILKGGQAKFTVHGGGHSMAIYEVSKDTTREHVGQYLCL